MTEILGKAVATAEQMATYLLKVNSNPLFSVNITAKEVCQMFLDICAKEGVRGDIAFAQSCKETGNFKFGGDVKYTQNNFCGLGATGGVSGLSFASIEEGILAQAQHLKTYATKDDLNEPCVDPRRTNWFVNAKGGTSPNVETLGGSWAVAGYDTKKYGSLAEANEAKDSYGWHIVDILNDIIAIPTGKDETNMSNSPLVDYVKISPNCTKPRKDKIKKITIHHMAGNLTVERCGEVFAPSTRKASSNYGIGSDGRVGMYVEEKNRSWCSSNADNDHQAVTIEVANDGGAPDWHVSDLALTKLIDLCVDICKRNGIEKLNFTGDKTGNLTMHKYFTATTCPGAYLESKFPYIAEEVNKRLGVTKEPIQKKIYRVQVGAFSVKENAVKLQAELKAKGYSAIITE